MIHLKAMLYFFHSSVNNLKQQGQRLILKIDVLQEYEVHRSCSLMRILQREIARNIYSYLLKRRILNNYFYT